MTSAAALPDSCRRRRAGGRAAVFALMVLTVAATLSLSGCNYFRTKQANRYVYVTAKQMVLRDRVAAVSIRTGMAYNGEKLEVLERARRFLKVKTPRGEVGWIEEKLTANQHTADEFNVLRADHAHDPVVATAQAHNEVYLHIGPGLDSSRFFRLAEGDNLSLLRRATVPKDPSPEQAAVTARIDAAAHSDAGAKGAADEPPHPPAPPPVLEDWWLVRDAKGQTGWIYSRMIDISAPEALERYAEGQRIVGAYVLAHVEDPDSGFVENGQTLTSIPEYVAVLSPYKAGLPYDFNQVRVFVWNVRKHHYETAFREHDIAGYLPVQISRAVDPYGKAAVAREPLPTFSYRLLPASSPLPAPNPTTGLYQPANLITKTFRLEGNICRRLLAPGSVAPEEAHPNLQSDHKPKKKRRG